MKSTVFLLNVLLCLVSVADRIDDDIKNNDILPCRWTKRVQEAFTLARNNGYPVLTFWTLPGCHLCKIARTYLTRDSFKSFIDSYGTIYLAYGDLSNESLKKWRENLFRNIKSKYAGYPVGHTEGRESGGSLPLPSYTLHFIDNGQTNFLFHIYRHSYDSTYNYAFCPYYKEITWCNTLYAWSNKETENGLSTKYDFPFIKVLKEYLEKVSPNPTVIPVSTPQQVVTTNSTTHTEQILYTQTIYLDNIVCRFNIPIHDSLCKCDFSSSSYIDYFEILDMTGCWFIDDDDNIRARNVDFKIPTENKCELILRSRERCNLRIASDPSEPLHLVSMSSMVVVTNTISDSATFYESGSVEYTTANEYEDYANIDRDFVCTNDTLFVLSAGDVIKLYGTDVRCTMFECER